MSFGMKYPPTIRSTKIYETVQHLAVVGKQKTSKPFRSRELLENTKLMLLTGKANKKTTLKPIDLTSFSS